MLPLAQTIEHALGHRRVEETLALSYSADSPDQVAALDLFQYVAGRPGHDRGEERFIVGERRQHQNLRFR